MHTFNFRKYCPICHEAQKNTLYCADYQEPSLWTFLQSQYGNKLQQIDFTNVKYSLVECPKCHLIYQEFIPNNKALDVIYNDEQCDPNIFADYDVNKFLDYSKEIIAALDFLKLKPKDAYVLDVGLGFSRWAMVAKAIGVKIYGIEYSQQLVEFAQKQQIKVITESQLTKEQFHFINSEQVFEHLANPLESAKNLSHSLAKDGVFKISVPSAPNIKQRIKKMDWFAEKFSKYSLNPVAPLEHIQCYQTSTLNILAEILNLKPTKIPLMNQYKYSNNFSNIKSSIRSMLYPIVLNHSHLRLSRWFTK